MSTVFYKMTLWPTEMGLTLITHKYISIRETKHTHFCLAEFEYSLNRCQQKPGESDWDTAKRRKIKPRRISKAGSRIAHPDEQAAFSHLIFLKRKQLQHMERDIEFINAFLQHADSKVEAGFEPDAYGRRVVPDTAALTNRHFNFDA
jgi:hypothetical protein